MNGKDLSFNPAASNRHPVDQLALIRETIRNLKEREDELKAEVSAAMGDADSLGGDEFIALQKITTRKGAIDEAAMRKAGIDVDKFRKPEVPVFSIRVEPRVSEVA